MIGGIGGICGIKRSRGGRDLLGVDQGDGFGSVHLDKEVLKRDVSKDLPRRFGYQGVVGTIWRWFVRRSVIQILILCLNRISISQMGYKGHHVQRSGLGRIRYWLELVLIPGEKLFVCLVSSNHVQRQVLVQSQLLIWSFLTLLLCSIHITLVSTGLSFTANFGRCSLRIHCIDQQIWRIRLMGLCFWFLFCSSVSWILIFYHLIGQAKTGKFMLIFLWHEAGMDVLSLVKIYICLAGPIGLKLGLKFGSYWFRDLVIYGSQKAQKCYGVLLRIGMDMVLHHNHVSIYLWSLCHDLQLFLTIRTVQWMWFWIGSSGLLTWKQVPCLVSSNQSQRVDSYMAKVLRSVLRLDQIDARMVTRPVEELYADLASINSSDLGSTSSMLMIHLDNGNNPGNGGYLDMLFGLGWTGSSRLLSIDSIANDQFGEEFCLFIFILVGYWSHTETVPNNCGWNSDWWQTRESYGTQWNSVEPNLGHNDGSDLLNHQMTLSSKRFSIFFGFGVILMWKIGKLWNHMGIRVADLASKFYLNQLHVKLIKRECMSLFSCNLQCCSYKDLRDMSILNGVLGLMVSFSSVVIILLSCNAFHDGWSSIKYDEVFHCVRYACGFWIFQDDGFKWRKIVFQMVNSKNFSGLFKPEFSCSKEQIPHFNI